MSGGPVVEEVERRAVDMLGPYHETEYLLARKIVTHGVHVNRVFCEMGVTLEPCAKPRKPSKRIRAPGVTGFEVIGSNSGKGKKKKVEDSTALSMV